MSSWFPPAVSSTPSWPLPLSAPLTPAEEEALASFQACLQSPFASVRDQGLSSLKEYPSLVPYLFGELVALLSPSGSGYVIFPLLSGCRSLPASVQTTLAARFLPFSQEEGLLQTAVDTLRSLPAIPPEILSALQAHTPTEYATFAEVSRLSAIFKHQPVPLLSKENRQALESLSPWSISAYTCIELLSFLCQRDAAGLDLMREWMENPSKRPKEFAFAGASQLLRSGHKEGLVFLTQALAGSEEEASLAAETLVSLGYLREVYENLSARILASTRPSGGLLRQFEAVALLEPDRSLEIFAYVFSLCPLLDPEDSSSPYHASFYEALVPLGEKLRALEGALRGRLEAEIDGVLGEQAEASEEDGEDGEDNFLWENNDPTHHLCTLLRVFSKAKLRLLPAERLRLFRAFERVSGDSELAERLFENLVEDSSVGDLELLWRLYKKTRLFLRRYNLLSFRDRIASESGRLLAYLEEEGQSPDIEIQVSAKKMLLSFPEEAVTEALWKHWLSLLHDPHPEIRLLASEQIVKKNVAPLGLRDQETIAEVLRTIAEDASCGSWRSQALRCLGDLFAAHPALEGSTFAWPTYLEGKTADLSKALSFEAFARLFATARFSSTFVPSLHPAAQKAGEIWENLVLGNLVRKVSQPLPFAVLRDTLQNKELPLFFRMGFCLSSSLWTAAPLRRFLLRLFQRHETLFLSALPIPGDARLAKVFRDVGRLLEEGFSTEEELEALCEAVKTISSEYSEVASEASYPWHFYAFYGISNALDFLELALSPPPFEDSAALLYPLSYGVYAASLCRELREGRPAEDEYDGSRFHAALEEALPEFERALQEAESEAQALQKFQTTAEEHLFSSS